ncbi:sugar phosphate isomerase/epimerase [Pseudoalteromonas sp. CO342X]|uniref:sugar phosphate isomerase/epimerase family protein n=1 Tax=Pseudoalteromonas sp. CO342X TaxID=1777270 RepID=UPI001022D2AD|nr:sugar phosphate isomerase/epimerase [Pseudoalteromonas sp. CO342X]RZG16665.1 sugar phosphate isomerase/epimerase [Pseudoalteromonas sp. CO342X]
MMFKKIVLFKQVMLFIAFIIALPLYAQASYQSLPISVQLWSVKDELARDFDGTLQALANMGFDGVEFAGNFGGYANNPSKLKQRLAELGLVASSAHIGFDALAEGKLASTLLFYKTLGVSTLFIPWDERAWDKNQVQAFVKRLNQVHQIAKRYDMKIGFHNHEKEFNPYANSTFWDYIATNTPSDFPLQLDVGWVIYAGKSPSDYVKRYAGRTVSTHIKIRTHQGDDKSPIIGENHYPWKALIQTMQQHGGTQWLVIEQEEYPSGLTPLESVARSKANLDKILSE